MADTKEILAAHKALIDRALKLTGMNEYHKYVERPEFAVLEIRGDDAILSWPEYESGYYDEGGSISTETFVFHVDFLALSEEDFEKWRADEEADYKKRKRAAEVEEAKQTQRLNEEKERALLAKLTKKYAA